MIKINQNIISNNSKTYFIADIAANFDGDIERAKDLIYLAADAGADAAKFQNFLAKTIVSDQAFNYWEAFITSSRMERLSIRCL